MRFVVRSYPFFPRYVQVLPRLSGRLSHYVRVARVFTGAVRVISIVSCNSSVRWKEGAAAAAAAAAAEGKIERLPFSSHFP